MMCIMYKYFIKYILPYLTLLKTLGFTAGKIGKNLLFYLPTNFYLTHL